MKSSISDSLKNKLMSELTHNIEENNLYFLRHDENRYQKYRQYLCFRYTDSGEKIGYLDIQAKAQSLEGDISYWLKEHDISFNEIDYQAMIDFAMTQTWSQLYWENDYDPQGFQVSLVIVGIPLSTFIGFIEDKDFQNYLHSWQKKEHDKIYVSPHSHDDFTLKHS